MAPKYNKNKLESIYTTKEKILKIPRRIKKMGKKKFRQF